MIAIIHGATSPARARLGSLLMFPHLVLAPSSSSKVEDILVLVFMVESKQNRAQRGYDIYLLSHHQQGKLLGCTPKADLRASLLYCYK